jgi:hypothetical protein
VFCRLASTPCACPSAPVSAAPAVPGPPPAPPFRMRQAGSRARSDRGCLICGPAVGDGFAHLRRQRPDELRVGLSAE